MSTLAQTSLGRLCRDVKAGDAAAAVELRNRTKPTTVSEFIEIIYGGPGFPPGRFDMLADVFAHEEERWLPTHESLPA